MNIDIDAVDLALAAMAGEPITQPKRYALVEADRVPTDQDREEAEALVADLGRTGALAAAAVERSQAARRANWYPEDSPQRRAAVAQAEQYQRVYEAIQAMPA